jgi:hypothetical protein
MKKQAGRPTIRDEPLRQLSIGFTKAQKIFLHSHGGGGVVVRALIDRAIEIGLTALLHTDVDIDGEL